MKRVIDVVAASVGLVLLSPVFGAVAVVVWLRLGRPILFKQVRPGLHLEPFTLWKFRTMREVFDANGRLLSDDERLTGLGRWLRRTSLDELPQLWNVLRGDLALVGPRPLLMEYLPLYSSEQARRHDVRPGLTGWAQVHGRNALSWDEKFALDVWYVDHVSLWLDLRILLRTVGLVCRGVGVSRDGVATVPPFTGRSLSEGTKPGTIPPLQQS
jgi:lipopolysaccharide/colanic/teichoic acid biosynthesis glycosyltransferase